MSTERYSAHDSDEYVDEEIVHDQFPEPQKEQPDE